MDRLGAAGGGRLWMFGLALWASGCGVQSGGACLGSADCVTLAVSTAGLDPALGTSLVLDDLELIVRVGESTRRVRFDDRVVRAPTELPLALPELGQNPQQRVAVYLRAHTSVGTTVQEVGALTQRLAGETLAPRYDLALTRTCVAAPCAVPEPRRGAALALDPQSRNLVLFGGRRQDGTALGDTWEWDGLGWHRVAAASAPAARAGHVMTRDARRGHLLLFGGAGSDELAPFADTWEYLGAGTGWHHLTDSGPPARWQAAMASAAIGDGQSQPGILLHGGVAAGGGTLGDTWVWDGQTWASRPTASDACTAAPQPSPVLPRCRRLAGLIPTAEQRALLVGGRLGPAGSGTSAELDDVVWQWDGTGWSQAAIYRPPAVLSRYGHFAGSAAPGSLALVALGDSPGGLRQDSYVLDLTSGQFVPQLGRAPDPRAEAAVAYDDERAEVVLLGGRGTSAVLGDVWSFTPSAGWRVHP